MRPCFQGVAAAWLRRSRFHFFHSISIGPNDHPRCRRLHDAIQQSPNIAFCVRELRFSLGVIKPFAISIIPARRELSTVLPQLLRCFTNLCKIEFYGFSWTVMTSDVKNSFYDILALPSLIHLELADLYFDNLYQITTLLRSHLRRLTVFFVMWGDNTTGDENEWGAATERRPCPLEHLTFDGHGQPDFVDYLLGPQSDIEVSHLRTLEVRHGLGETGEWVKLMGNARSSLEHLIIQHFGFDSLGALSSSFFGRLPRFYKSDFYRSVDR
jgi:hypothetical protein